LRVQQVLIAGHPAYLAENVAATIRLQYLPVIIPSHRPECHHQQQQQGKPSHLLGSSRDLQRQATFGQAIQTLDQFRVVISQHAGIRHYYGFRALPFRRTAKLDEARELFFVTIGDRSHVPIPAFSQSPVNQTKKPNIMFQLVFIPTPETPVGNLLNNSGWDILLLKRRDWISVGTRRRQLIGMLHHRLQLVHKCQQAVPTLYSLAQ